VEVDQRFLERTGMAKSQAEETEKVFIQKLVQKILELDF
jgi:hypothetical protein